MKAIFQIFILFFLFISIAGYSQNTIKMQEGETITVNVNGNITDANIPSEIMTKQSTTLEHTGDKNTIFNDDGTYKIPGYTPTGIIANDEENYKRAKLQFYQSNPQEYEKLFGHKPSTVKIAVRIEEFQKMPEIKQQQILANPDKYYLEDTNNNSVQDN